jgi:hypothetical protein
MPSKGGVGTVMIVIVEPFRKGLLPLLVRAVDTRIGPLAEHRLDKALRLAIGLWAIGPNDLVAELELAYGVAERVGPGVAKGAVGHDPLDVDALIGEESCGRQEEAGGRLRQPVGQDLGEGKAGGVIDRDVDDLIAQPTMTVGGSLASQDPMPAPGGMRPSGFMSRWSNSPGWSRT